MDAAQLSQHRVDHPDSITLGEARERLREGLSDGMRCPCCTQHAQTYRRKLNSSMVRLLAALYHEGGTSRFVHAAEVARRAGLSQQGDAGKLALWGLVIEEPQRRPDGGRSGYWIVTDLGEEYLHARSNAREYAVVFDGRLLRYEGGWSPVRKALGRHFSYDELMRGS